MTSHFPPVTFSESTYHDVMPSCRHDGPAFPTKPVPNDLWLDYIHRDFANGDILAEDAVELILASRL